jgi:hypothetical protein
MSKNHSKSDKKIIIEHSTECRMMRGLQTQMDINNCDGCNKRSFLLFKHVGRVLKGR